MRWDFTADQAQAYDPEYVDAAPAPDVGFARISGYSRFNDTSIIAVDVVYQDVTTDVHRENVLLESADYGDARARVVAAADLSEDEASATATSGSTTTIVLSTATYAPDAKIGKIVTVTAGTNSGEAREISDNDGTSITFPAMSAACDNTTVFEIGTSVVSLLEDVLLTAAMTKLGVAGALV